KGKADAKRLAAFLAGTLPNGQLERVDDGKGSTVSIVTAPKAPAFALIGDTDLLMAGYGTNRGDHIEVLKQMLKLSSEGKGGVLDGPLAPELKKLSSKAIAIVVGELSKGAGVDFQRGLGVPLPTPSRVRLELARSAQGVDLSMAG